MDAILSALQECLQDPWWLRMKHAMITNPCGDLLHIFFSAYLAPDHAKWDRIQALSDQLAVNPRDWELWLRRAVLYLQCGVGLYADSDAKEGLKLKKHGLLPQERESSFYTIIMLARLKVHVIQKSTPATSWFQALTCLQPLSHRVDVISELNFAFTSNLFSKDIPPEYQGFHVDGSDWIFLPSPRRISDCAELMDRAFNASPLSPVAKAFSFALFTCMDCITQDTVTAQLEGKQLKINTLMQRYNATVQSVSVSNLEKYFIPLYYGRRDPKEVLRLLKTYRGNLMHSVDVVECPQKGGLTMIAKRAIQRGEILFIEPAVIDFRATDKNADPVCAQCWNAVNPRKVTHRCSSCSDLYCSAGCRQQAEDEGHRHLCSSEWTNYRQSSSIYSGGNMAIEVFGLSFKLHAMAKQRGLATAMDLPEMRMLRSRQDSNDPSEHLQFMNCNYDVGAMAQYIDIFNKRFPSLFENISASEIYSIFNITFCNTVGSSGKSTASMNHEINVSLYLLMSFMNNDCANPAAEYKSVYCMGKRQLSVIAERNIKAGEEITCRYNDNPNDHDRKIVLRDTYRFFCECAKCKNIKIGAFGTRWG